MKALLSAILVIGILSFSFAAEKENKEEVNAEVSQLSLTGKVVDKETQEALVGVKITLDGIDQVAYTDFDGHYQFTNIEKGNYNLTASYISYEKSTVKNIELSLKESQVNISLEIID